MATAIRDRKYVITCPHLFEIDKNANVSLFRLTNHRLFILSLRTSFSSFFLPLELDQFTISIQQKAPGF